MDSSNIKKIVPSLEHFTNLFLIFSSRCPISIPVDLPPAPTFWKTFHNNPIPSVSLWPIKTKPCVSPHLLSISGLPATPAQQLSELRCTWCTQYLRAAAVWLLLFGSKLGQLRDDTSLNRLNGLTHLPWPPRHCLYSQLYCATLQNNTSAYGVAAEWDGGIVCFWELLGEHKVAWGTNVPGMLPAI